MGLANNLDQRVPVLDAWMSIPVRMLVLPTPTGSGAYPIMTDLAGYSISCIPSQQLRGVTSSIAKGRNIYAQLILLIKESLVAQGYTTATPRIKVVKDARDKWQVAIGIADTTMTSLFVRMPVYMDFDYQRAANPRWLGFEETWGGASGILFAPNPSMGMGLWAVTKYGTISAWQPEHMGWTTESDRQVEYRVAKSPYDPRAESRLFWGVSDTKRLEISMVHAADVFRDRNADIPCEGWAAAAHTKEFHGNTIERILPWWSSAKPQRFPSMLNPAGADALWHRDGAEEDPPPWTPLELGPLVWLDPSDMATLFVDSAGTTPVTASGDPVGLWRNKGTAGVTGDAVQTVSAGRPVWSSADGGKVVFDGVSSVMLIAYQPTAWGFTMASLSSGGAHTAGTNVGAGGFSIESAGYVSSTHFNRGASTIGAEGTARAGTFSTGALIGAMGAAINEFAASGISVHTKYFSVSSGPIPAPVPRTQPGGIKLGAVRTTSLFTAYSQKDFFVFDRILTTNERAKLLAWMESR